MTVRHLKLFAEVYKTMNITKAAENLNMTQPTVSRAIQELEDHYGVKLFDRMNKRIKPTEAAARFYSYALHTLESFEYMEEGMLRWKDKEVIRIGATISIGSAILPKLITRFKEMYPDVMIRSVVSNGSQIEGLLRENQLDFALIEGYITGEHMFYEGFLQDRLAMLLPPEDPRCGKQIPIEALKDDGFLLREKGSFGRNYIDGLFASHGLPLEPVMESASIHAIVQAVHAGIGVSILPEILVEHSITSGFVGSCTIDGVNLVRQNYIVWHEGKYLTAKVKEFMSLCKSLSAELFMQSERDTVEQ